MSRLKLIIYETIKSILIGVIFGGSLGILVFIFALIFYLGKITNALNIVRSLLLFIGSLALFCTAGFFLSRGANSKFSDIEGWRRHFKILTPVYVIFSVSIGIILFGMTIDFIIFIL